MNNALNVNISVQIFREGENFVAHSPAFDLSTFGRSLEQAKHRFGEAVEVFLEECMERGTLKDVLLDLGWKESDRNHAWEPPMLVENTIQRVAVPVA